MSGTPAGGWWWALPGRRWQGGWSDSIRLGPPRAPRPSASLSCPFPGPSSATPWYWTTHRCRKSESVSVSHSIKPDFYLQIRTERRPWTIWIGQDITCVSVCSSYCKSLDIFAEQVIHHILRQQRLQLVDVTLALELRVTHHLHTGAETKTQSDSLSSTSSMCLLCYSMVC